MTLEEVDEGKELVVDVSEDDDVVFDTVVVDGVVKLVVLDVVDVDLLELVEDDVAVPVVEVVLLELVEVDVVLVLAVVLVLVGVVVDVVVCEVDVVVVVEMQPPTKSNFIDIQPLHSTGYTLMKRASIQGLITLYTRDSASWLP